MIRSLIIHLLMLTLFMAAIPSELLAGQPTELPPASTQLADLSHPQPQQEGTPVGDPCGDGCLCPCCPGHVLPPSASTVFVEVPTGAEQHLQVVEPRSLHPYDLIISIFHPPRLS